MQNGCLCCTVKGDLEGTLEDLHYQRSLKEIAPFTNVMIETTGLADPAPILHLLMTDMVIGGRYRLDGVVATIDAVNGARTLDNHPEALRQAAVADRLLITKTDLAAPDVVDSLIARLEALNPVAPKLSVLDGDAPVDALFGLGLYNPASKSHDVRRWLGEEAHADEHDHHHGHHHHDVTRHDDHIRSFTLTADRPLAWGRFSAWLEVLTERRGPDLLRVKGIVDIAEAPGEPMVIHGVQHIFHPPGRLPAWPSDDRRTRIVVIARDLDPAVVDDLQSGLTAAAAR
jgi:G3E family GTPase